MVRSIAKDISKYMWQKLKVEKPNIRTKQILKPSVAIVVETHSELNTITIKVNNQMLSVSRKLGVKPKSPKYLFVMT